MSGEDVGMSRGGYPHPRQGTLGGGGYSLPKHGIQWDTVGKQAVGIHWIAFLFSMSTHPDVEIKG